MFINRAKEGRNNLCGRKITAYRRQMQPAVSQRAFADRLQLEGLDLTKNAIQRIESGERFATDIELVVIARALNCRIEDLLELTSAPGR